MNLFLGKKKSIVFTAPPTPPHTPRPPNELRISPRGDLDVENSIFQVPDAAKGPQGPTFTKNQSQNKKKNENHKINS